MGIVLLTSIILTTIVYSAYNTQLQIKGEAILRNSSDIRVTGLKVVNQTNGAIETYNSKYGKDSTTLYATLPSNGSITYEVTITNKTNKDYDVSVIQNLNNTNSNIGLNIGLKVGDVVSKGNSKTFTIVLKNNTSIQQVGTFVYQYFFIEHINSYIVGNYNNPQMYEVKIPYTGEYKIELWGASGGQNFIDFGTPVYYPNYGLGGYTSGTITLAKGTSLYVYVGEQGADGIIGYALVNKSSFNGGGAGIGSTDLNDAGGSGGGATDIRITNGEWDNIDSLKSRIMVAGGGAGGPASNLNTTSAGSGGGLNGVGNSWGWNKVEYDERFNATQTVGYKFGIGENGYSNGTGGSGGGGGWYGGLADNIHGLYGGGGGGSSFISGHNGCDAITADSTSTNIKHTGQSNHYSGYVFTETVMIDGEGCNWTNVKGSCSDTGQTQPDGSKSKGHIGNGYARITFIKRIFD